MAEEQRCEEPGVHRLCANNCGFFGSPTTLNLCSKCYKNHCIKEQHMEAAQLAMKKTLIKTTPSSSSSSSSSYMMEPLPVYEIPAPPPPREAAPAEEEVGGVGAPDEVQSKSNRCVMCRKRVGLTGFKCRCGTVFCGSHRYPEQHGCTFDYKTVGRVAIAKANPVVKGEKLDKI